MEKIPSNIILFLEYHKTTKIKQGENRRYYEPIQDRATI